MDFYLVQHGVAFTKEEDPQRALSEVGRFEVTQVARFAAERRLDLGAIRHSGKRRAQQTAEILAEHTAPGTIVTVMPGLDPNDDVETTRRVLDESDVALTLVGHLPHLSRLAATLLAGGPDLEPIAFRNGAIVALSREEGWRVRFVLTPELAGA